MHHRDGDRVVDEVHPHEYRQVADQVEPVLELGDHGLHLTRPPRRRVHHIPAGQRRSNGLPHAFQLFTRPKAHVDAVDASFLAERHLRRIDVHHRQVPPHGLGRPLRVEDAPDAEGLYPLHRLHPDLLVEPETLPVRHGLGYQDGVGFGQEQ